MKKLLAVTTVFAVGGTFAATQADAAQYRVKSGDSLWKISQIYGTSVQALKRENGLRSNLIHVNQVLNINENTTQRKTYKSAYKPTYTAPVTTGSYYRIVPGDTLGKIASRYGVSVAQLKAWNGLHSDLIIAGRTLKVNGPAVAAAPVTRTAYQAPVKRAVAKSTYQAPVRQTVYNASTTKRVTTTRTQAPAVRVNNGLNWAALARCESGGNPSINTGNGYYGMYQFNLQTWRGVGGSGYPHQASAAEQTKRAQILYNMRGAQPWPVCGARL